MPGFRFKQFNIEQDRCAMKVGTDGVLIGSWCNTTGVKTVLDVGCGTGLIALMVAQRCNGEATITGLEIDQEAAEQAKENVAGSPWSKTVTIIHTSMQDYRPDTTIDLVVSNPPYFTNALKAPDAKRSAARHNDSLSVEDLVHFAKQHLSATGRLSVVLPCEEAKRLVFEGIACGLYLQRTTSVQTKANKQPKRMLVELGKEKAPSPQEDTLVLGEGADNKMTTQFKALVRDFYLYVD
ncbi:MAG: methyltransferase [Paludibacteraceae bacterium]|nr:methyltransferase [Paludibacteraceae bacterium]